MNKILKEFKEFAMRGNVLDLAIAVVIGAAFGSIVTSAVNDLLMPLIGRIIGEPSFSHLTIDLGKGAHLAYGNFLQTIFDFVVIAFCVFLVIKAMKSVEKKKQETPAAPAAPTSEEKLLTEIRDILKNK